MANWPFHVPLVSSALALYRSLGALNTNAVEPRVRAYRDEWAAVVQQLQLLHDEAAERVPGYRFARFGGRDDAYRQTVDGATAGLLNAVVNAATRAFDRVPIVVDMESLPLQRLQDIAVAPGSFSGSPFVKMQNAVYASFREQRLAELLSTDNKTTLARFEPGLAIALVVAGYVNTFYWSNYLRMFDEGDLDLIDGVVDRMVQRLRPPNVKLIANQIKEPLRDH